MVTFCKGKNCFAVGLLALLPAAALVAQQKTYRLPELETATKKNLPVLFQKQALVSSSHASVTEVRHSFLPRLRVSDQLNLGTDNSLAGSYLPIGITPSSSAGVRAKNEYQPVTGNIGVLYGDYDLVTFGLHRAAVKNAEAYLSLQQADLAQEMYNVEKAVAAVYLNLLKTQYRLGADKQNTDRYDSIFKVIRALAASGIKPGADSSLAKAELSKARITYNQTLGNLNQLKDELAYFTGIPATSLYIDSLTFPLNSMQVFESLPADTVNNPLLDYYTKKNNILITEQGVINKSYLPEIKLAAAGWVRGSGIQYNDDYTSLATGLGYQRYNYMAGLAITYNLFNGLYKRDRLTISRFELQAGAYELQQQKSTLALAASQAADALQTNEANLQELPVQLKAAEDTYRQKLAQYRAGIISLIDLTNASFVLYRSQTDFIETRNEWYQAMLDKAAANGTLEKFIQAIK